MAAIDVTIHLLTLCVAIFEIGFIIGSKATK